MGASILHGVSIQIIDNKQRICNKCGEVIPENTAYMAMDEMMDTVRNIYAKCMECFWTSTASRPVSANWTTNTTDNIYLTGGGKP